MATPETAIKKEIKDWLRLHQWFVFYLLAGIGAYTGASDLIAIKKGLVLFIEVKTKNGKMSPGQLKFRADIKNHGGHYVLARSYEDVEKYLREHCLCTNEQ